VDARAPTDGPAGEHIERLERHGAVGVRVVVRIDPVDVRLALAPLQAVHVVLRGLVHVDGVLVDQDLGGEQVHLAQDARAVRGRVDDHDVLGGGRAQRDLRGREVLRAPVPAPVVRLAHVTALAEECEQVVCRPRSEPLAGLEGELEGGRAQVREQDVEVVRVQACLLGAAAEHELRVVDHVLVHRGWRGDEDRHRHVTPPPGAAHLLPGGGDGPRVAGEHRHVQAADVDAQLEGVRADHAEHLAIPQAAFDGAPLRGQVAAPVAADPAARPKVLAQRLAQVREHDLHRHAGPPEHHRLAPGPQERQGPALGQREGGATGTRRRVHDRRVHQQQVLLARRRPVAVDQPHGPPREGLGQLRGVSDGGRAADDDRVRPVVRTQPQQPAQHVGDVGPEHTPVRVELVDDDDAELLEQLEPLGVVGEDRRVEHVGVGDHHLACLADGRADGRRRVPVIAGGRDLQPRVPHQLPELRDLVLAQRLGGEQEQRPGGRVLGQGLEHRHGVAERLAGCGGRDHDDVLTGVHRLDGIRLVRVRPLDPALGEPVADPRVQPLRPVAMLRRPGLPDLVVDHAAGKGRFVEKLVEDRTCGGGGVGTHAGSRCIWNG